MKITKFLALAFAALAFASCTKSTSVDNNEGGGQEINSPTHATFKFNIKNGTKAAADFDPVTIPEQEATDKKIGKMQLLIFNATTQALEFNEVVTGATTKTVLLTAGKKKIFVVANSDKLTAYNTAIDPATFVVGAVNTTLADFHALQFDAGAPQKLGAPATRTFDFSGLYGQSSSSTGIPMSNTNEITYTLAVGVDETTATGGTAVNGGISATNTFNIQLYFMTAKANLKLATGVLNTAAGKPVIKDVQFSIRNLARKTNYVQNVPTAGNPQSAYFTFNGATQADFDAEFDYASNISVSLTETASDYLYVPENNNALLQRGQASYFAIQATYEPEVHTDAVYNINSKVTYTTKALAVSGSKDYIYTTGDVEGIAAGTYYSSVTVFAKDAWIRKNGKAYADADHSDEAMAIITGAGNPYQSFTNATSYYRVDLGAGDGSATEYGVLRSNKYNATINKITGPGVPSEDDLVADSENPVSAKTYISATILPAEWSTVSQSADL